MRKTLVVVLIAALALSFPAGLVGAAEQRAVAGPGGFFVGYLTLSTTPLAMDSAVDTTSRGARSKEDTSTIMEVRAPSSGAS